MVSLTERQKQLILKHFSRPTIEADSADIAAELDEVLQMLITDKTEVQQLLELLREHVLQNNLSVLIVIEDGKDSGKCSGLIGGVPSTVVGMALHRIASEPRIEKALFLRIAQIFSANLSQPKTMPQTSKIIN